MIEALPMTGHSDQHVQNGRPQGVEPGVLAEFPPQPPRLNGPAHATQPR